jgi:hypothetical protein
MQQTRIQACTGHALRILWVLTTNQLHNSLGICRANTMFCCTAPFTHGQMAIGKVASIGQNLADGQHTGTTENWAAAVQADCIQMLQGTPSKVCRIRSTITRWTLRQTRPVAHRHIQLTMRPVNSKPCVGTFASYPLPPKTINCCTSYPLPPEAVHHIHYHQKPYIISTATRSCTSYPLPPEAIPHIHCHQKPRSHCNRRSKILPTYQSNSEDVLQHLEEP